MQLVLAIVAAMLAAAPSGSDGSFTTWTGAIDSDWSVSANWTGGIPTIFSTVTIPAGTPNVCSTQGFTGAICESLTVSSGATLQIAQGFPLEVRQSVVNQGDISGFGMLYLMNSALAPSTNGTLSGWGNYDVHVTIVKGPTGQIQATSNLTLGADLIVTSGELQLTNSVLVSVAGSAQFQGGLLSVVTASTILDVGGNVTFQGTSATGILPTIRCAGHWSSNAAFAPQACHVIMDGNGNTQSLAAAGAFNQLTIQAGATVWAGSALTVNWTLAINGSLTMGALALDANGPVTVAATGALDLGGGTDTFGGSFTVNGSLTATGTLVFDGGSSNNTISSVATLPSVQIANAAGSSTTVHSDLVLTGNLVVTSGTFVVAHASYTVSVAGNAQFTGGTLTVASVGAIIDVAGNVTFSGTTATATLPTIRCGGNWSANAGYAPSNALVVFDGTGAQTISGTAAFDDVTVAQGSSVSVSAALSLGGALTVNGLMTVAPHALDVNGPLTVASTGSLNLGGGTHTFGDNLAVTGALVATGTLVFDGSSTQAAMSSTAALPSVQVSKTGNSVIRVGSNLTVNGNLTQTSGVFQVAQGPHTVTVAGNALFQGGTLQTFNVGILDVAGNVTFSGTDATGGVPIIKCAGNWTSNAAYAPSLGVAMLDGSGSQQTINGAGIFDDLTIMPGANVTSNVSMTVNGPLIVNGSLGLGSHTLDANGALNVPAGGSLNLGGGTHTFGSDFTANGTLTATGTLVFDGGIAVTQIIASAALPNVQIAKTAGTYSAVASNLTVNGNVTVVSGIFRVANGTQTVAVSGNALFQGGELTALGLGILDVAGAVTFSGTVVNGPTPTIRCAGNWTSNAAFAPSSCFVELDGSSPTTMTHTGATFPATTFTVKNGPRTILTDFLFACNAITVDANASLAIGGRHVRVHSATLATPVTVNGGLSVGTNGNLGLGPNASLTVAVSGSLSLVGTPAQPARITGEAGGGYGLTVSGALSAKNFLVKEMGNAGMVVNPSAAIAAAPNDLRGGTFDFRAGATAGAVLLDMRRQAPAAFRYVAFLNTPGLAGVFNVKTVATSAPFSFTNWTGAFAGPSFESDPGNQIAWNPPELSLLAQFAVQPGAELAEVTWRTSAEVDLAGFEIQRATSAAGPFTTVFTTPLLGPIGWQYGFVDSPLVPNQTYFYTLYAKLTHDALAPLASGSTTPYSSALPANVKKVGPTGPFTTIQAAINAATDANSVVWVTPGTYPSFTIGATPVPSNLRILGDDSGPVVIDTSTGPIQIANVPAGRGVELSNLVVGSPATAQNGVVITNCGSPVVLDEVDVSCDGAHTAVSVSNAPQAAIQRSDIQGGTGLQVTNGSYVAISRGSLSSLVSTGSTIEMATLTPGSVSVAPAGSLIARSGLMPDINLPEIVHISVPSAMFVTAAPNAPYAILASPRLGFQTGPSFEMPFLLDVAGAVQLPVKFTDAAGLAVTGFEVAPVPLAFGFAFTVQVAVADPVSGALQLSNVESMTCIP